MRNRLSPADISAALRACVEPGKPCPRTCPYADHHKDGTCIRQLCRDAADAIDNQHTHIKALIRCNDAHREMVAQAPKPPAKRGEMVEALDAIETGMTRLAMSRDIWQNNLVYTLCQGVRLLLEDRIKNRGAR